MVTSLLAVLYSSGVSWQMPGAVFVLVQVLPTQQNGDVSSSSSVLRPHGAPVGAQQRLSPLPSLTGMAQVLGAAHSPGVAHKAPAAFPPRGVDVSCLLHFLRQACFFFLLP